MVGVAWSGRLRSGSPSLGWSLLPPFMTGPLCLSRGTLRCSCLPELIAQDHEDRKRRFDYAHHLVPALSLTISIDRNGEEAVCIPWRIVRSSGRGGSRAGCTRDSRNDVSPRRDSEHPLAPNLDAQDVGAPGHRPARSCLIPATEREVIWALPEGDPRRRGNDRGPRRGAGRRSRRRTRSTRQPRLPVG